MKLLSFQSGSIYLNGGCGRLLRRLYQGMEQHVVSLGVNPFKVRTYKGSITESNLFIFPFSHKWLRWKFRDLNDVLLKGVFLKHTKKKLHIFFLSHEFDVIHVVNHGLLSAFPCQDKYLKGKKLWVSFHDHYNVASFYKDAKMLWEKADRRLVISCELGDEYQRIFSNKPYEVITDGLYENEISEPKITRNNKVTFYFGGLLHHDYHPLFKALADALDIIIKKDKVNIRFVLRGTDNVSFLNKRLFEIEYRNTFVTDAEIKREQDEADILYLPVKFNSPQFYLYSMSTKMIGYLGAKGKIFYHGPAESALCSLLSKANAAVCCKTLNINDVIAAIDITVNNAFNVSANAKKLALNNFRMENLKTIFWDTAI